MLAIGWQGREANAEVLRTIREKQNIMRKIVQMEMKQGWSRIKT